MPTRTVSHGHHPRSVSGASFNWSAVNGVSDRLTPSLFVVGDEITILGSFSETYKFPAAVDYLDSGKVRVNGIVNKTFKLEQWAECLEAMKNKTAIKAAITFD